MTHDHVWKKTKLFVWVSTHPAKSSADLCSVFQNPRGPDVPIPNILVSLEICACGAISVNPNTYSEFKKDGLILEEGTTAASFKLSCSCPKDGKECDGKECDSHETGYTCRHSSIPWTIAPCIPPLDTVNGG